MANTGVMFLRFLNSLVIIAVRVLGARRRRENWDGGERRKGRRSGFAREESLFSPFCVYQATRLGN